jgi:protein-tyrosine phosphatase
MAEVLLRRRLVSLGASVTVSSAGVLGNGRAATPEAVAVMHERGLDLSAHVSRPLDREVIAAADLILAMTREHVREVCAMDPGAWPRAFTLKELARRTSVVAPRGPTLPFADWLADVAEGRSMSDLIGSDDADDVEDPLGYGKGIYRGTADEIDGLLAAVVPAAWPEVRATAEGAA